jgi:hypothetical protein
MERMKKNPAAAETAPQISMARWRFVVMGRMVLAYRSSADGKIILDRD